MKRIIIPLFFLITLLMSCQKAPELIGSWQIDNTNTSGHAGLPTNSKLVVTFKSDDTYNIVDEYKEVSSGRYEISNDNKTLILNSKTQPKQICDILIITKETLRITPKERPNAYIT